MERDPPITKAPGSPTGQNWDATAYGANGRFVANLAGAVVDLLAPLPGERILDIGCGDGALTESIAARGAAVTGIDSSTSMLAAARSRGIDVRHISAADLDTLSEFDASFDAAFSNAALHWIPEPDHPRTLGGIRSILRPGGRLVAEMGGQGNIAAIRTALSAVLSRFGVDAEAEAASFYPSAARYRSLLEEAGFTVHQIDLVPRPTPLPGGPHGMRIWLNTFRNGVLDRLPGLDRESALTDTIELLRPILSDHGESWTADYVRLRFQATR